MADRMFPIQGGGVGRARVEPSEIPWWLAEEAYAQYAHRHGFSQSL